MEQSRTMELQPETACSISIPKLSESRRVIQEINSYPRNSDKSRTLSISTRVLDGVSGRITPTKKQKGSKYAVNQRLFAQNPNVNPNTTRVAPILKKNEAFSDKLYINSRKSKKVFLSENPMNITSIWADNPVQQSPRNKPSGLTEPSQYLTIRENNNSFLEKSLSPERSFDKHQTTQRLYIKNMIKDLERKKAPKVKNKTGLQILMGSTLGQSTDKEPGIQNSFKYLPNGASAVGGAHRNAQYQLYKTSPDMPRHPDEQTYMKRIFYDQR